MKDFREMSVPEYIENRKLAGCNEISVRGLLEDMNNPFDPNSKLDLLLEVEALVNRGKLDSTFKYDDQYIK